MKTAIKTLTFFATFFLAVFFITTTNSCKQDPCDGKLCLNNGHCANGQCVCPPGFTGADCSQKITPTKIFIKKITVTQFPATDNGAGWDLTSGAELFPTLYLGTTVVWDSPNYFQNADPNIDYEFIPSPSIELSNPTIQYILRIYDYDSADPNDYMGGIIFTPYSTSLGFPSQRTLDAGAGVAFRLDLAYIW